MINFNYAYKKPTCNAYFWNPNLPSHTGYVQLGIHFKQHLSVLLAQNRAVYVDLSLLLFYVILCAVIESLVTYLLQARSAVLW